MTSLKSLLTTSISLLHIIVSLSRICHGSPAQSEQLSPASQTLDSGLTWSDEEGIDDLKKATLLNLLRVMGETRMLEHEVPIVFNRESELFQSYLEQRERSPRKVDYPPSGSGDEVNTSKVKADSREAREVGEGAGTLFREDTRAIKTAASHRNHVDNLYHHDNYYQGKTTPTPDPIRAETFPTTTNSPALQFQYFPAVAPSSTSEVISHQPKTHVLNGYHVDVSSTISPRPAVATIAPTRLHQPTPSTTPKTLMNLVNDQPYTTSEAADVLLYSTSTTTTTTQAPSSGQHVKTYQAYSGSLQTPTKHAPPVHAPGEFYYKPLVEPVYQPAEGNSLHSSSDSLSGDSLGSESTRLPPPPAPPAIVVKHLPPATQQTYSPNGQHQGLTTPHPLIYGFKPVQKDSYPPPPPPPPHIKHRPPRPVITHHANRQPPKRPPKQLSALRPPLTNSFFPPSNSGELRTIYSSNSRPHPHPPLKKLPVAHTKPIRFPLAARSFFKAVFS